MSYFSSTDPNCMANRRQMSKGGVNQMNSFLKKKFLYLFYLTVQCQITEPCLILLLFLKRMKL